MAKRKNTSYISGRESHEISRFNRKLTACALPCSALSTTEPTG